MTELLLELLVGKVDAELLEAVGLERLEAVNVEHADERVGRRGALQAAINLRHDPVEQLRVHVLGERVTSEQCLQCESNQSVLKDSVYSTLFEGDFLLD